MTTVNVPDELIRLGKNLGNNMKSIVDDITRAWNELDPEFIVRHLSPDFRYDSQWVFDYLTYDGYVEYIRGKYKTLRERGIPIEAVTVEDPHLGGWMTKIVQRLGDKENVCYYRIEMENGLVVKGDLCMF